MTCMRNHLKPPVCVLGVRGGVVLPELINGYKHVYGWKAL